MRQLSALDSNFIFNETPNCPQHIGGLAIYDPSTAPDRPVRFKAIMETMTERLQSVAMTRQRLVEVPMNADFPYWIDAEDFDPEFHIRHIALPKPGDWRQLCIQVARIYARPLDRSRPLWEAYVIEGLDNIEGIPEGCFAILSKTHHAAIDGSSSSDMGAALSDLSPIPDPNRLPVKRSWKAEKVPTARSLMTRTAMNRISKPLRFTGSLARTAPNILGTASKMARGKIKSSGKAPRTRFSGVVTSHRVFEGVSFELEEIKRIKNAVGGTINDVVLVICAGALRNYLNEKGELPKETLISMCPINIRNEKVDINNAESGNEVSAMSVELRTDIADPAERLHAICKATQDAKAYTNAVGAKTMLELAQYMPTTLAASGAKLAAHYGLARYTKPMYNTVTTNVPGPPIPLYSYGSKLIAHYGLGLVQDSMGLFHTIGSYCDNVTIGVTACRTMMPDPERYAELLRASMHEISAAV